MSQLEKHLKPKGNFLSANYKELIVAGIALVGAYFVRFFVQAVDPTAGVTDLGMLDTLAFAMVAVLVSYAFLCVVLRVALKTFNLYLDGKEFRKDFLEKANPNVRIAAVLVVIFGNLILVVEFAKIFSGVR